MNQGVTMYRAVLFLLAVLLPCGFATFALADDTTAQLARGAEIFAANCATCHGPQGFGDGPADAGRGGIKPRNGT